MADEGVKPHEERMQVKRDSPRAEALICSFSCRTAYHISLRKWLQSV